MDFEASFENFGRFGDVGDVVHAYEKPAGPSRSTREFWYRGRMEEMRNAALRWLRENEDDMLLCPYQPGGLRISRYACAKRHIRAKENEKMITSLSPEMDVEIAAGLARCMNCSIGRSVSRSRQTHSARRIPLPA